MARMDAMVFMGCSFVGLLLCYERTLTTQPVQKMYCLPQGEAPTAAPRLPRWRCRGSPFAAAPLQAWVHRQSRLYASTTSSVQLLYCAPYASELAALALSWLAHYGRSP